MSKEQKPPGQLWQRIWKNLSHNVFSRHMFFIILTSIKGWFIKAPKISISTLTRRTNQTVVLTGGNRGIGLSALKILLQLDYTVILGVRDVQETATRIKEIRTLGISSGKFRLFQLDLKSLTSVRKFASQVLASNEGQRIDALLNNAGITYVHYETTEDNFESHFQVNYLSHFLLTNLLLPRIQKTALEKIEPCQIIHTSSILHRGGKICFNELETSKVYCSMKCYMDAKLCQIMHAKSLEEKFQKSGMNIHAYAVHPGEIPTDNWATICEGFGLGNFFNFVSPLLKCIYQTPDDAANTVLNTLLRPTTRESKKGGYFEKMKLTIPNSQTFDVEVRERLWNRSAELTQGIVFSLS